jgi:hypothetical protein
VPDNGVFSTKTGFSFSRFAGIEKKLQDFFQTRHQAPTITPTYTQHLRRLGFVKPKNLA